MRDFTKVTSQPALTSSSGTVWLVVGGLFSAICLGVLIPMSWLKPPGVGLFGSLSVVALYLTMVITRFTISRIRDRLLILASLMGVIALVSLTCAALVVWAQWTSL